MFLVIRAIFEFVQSKQNLRVSLPFRFGWQSKAIELVLSTLVKIAGELFDILLAGGFAVAI